MPVVRNKLITALRNHPGLRQIVFAAWEPLLRLALLPFRLLLPGRGAGPGAPTDPGRQVAEYNAAAERYYAADAHPQRLIEKPFGDTPHFARHLIAAGLLIEGARLRPGDTVAELGAGSCWLSHFLNRYGCRTIAIDVSASALALGRQLFERDPRTDWSLDPQFLTYAGQTLPLRDAACDRIVVYDAFHHVPNQREILAEMHRVLAADGIAAMSEPGYGHASAWTSLVESGSTGVLENELAIGDLAALAESVGFRQVTVLAAGPAAPFEVAARDLKRFAGGKGFREYWKRLCHTLMRHHYVLMFKGRTQPTTERPGRLAARIAIDQPAGPVTRSCTEPTRVVLRVANTGDTRWLHAGAGAARAGWTRIGIHLHGGGTPIGPLIDHDWYRAPLERDIDPGGQFTVALDVPPLNRPGVYALYFDLVVERLTWFADRGGSRPAALQITAV